MKFIELLAIDPLVIRVTADLWRLWEIESQPASPYEVTELCRRETSMSLNLFPDCGDRWSVIG